MTTSPLPKISVLIVTFNGQATLADTLRSVLAQSLQPEEILLVDDGSTDGSAEIAASFGPAIRVLQQPNLGNAIARNVGISAAAGELVALLDDDDIWHPEKLRRQSRLHVEKPGLDFSITGFRYFKDPEHNYPTSREPAYWERSHAGWIPSALMLKKQSFGKIGDFDARFSIGNDADFFFRAIDAGVKWEAIPEVLLHKRLRPGSESMKVEWTQADLLKLVAASVIRKKRQEN